MSSIDGAAARWAARVRTEHEQADRVRSDDPSADHWRKLAHRFTPASREKALQDETFVATSRLVGESDTVIDVGAGAGRLAVPLAERCRHVTAVEPSEAMQSQLKQQASAWNLTNLTVVGSTWEDAEVEQADIVICAHVVYTVEHIDEFIRKLTDRARREVLVVVFDESAMANHFPLWQRVYGEERISLPTLPGLKEVLTEMKIAFTTEPLPEWQSRPFPDLEAAYQESLARLFISPPPSESAAVSGPASLLRDALQEVLVPFENGLHFEWAKPHRPWLVRWDV